MEQMMKDKILGLIVLFLVLGPTCVKANGNDRNSHEHPHGSDSVSDSVSNSSSVASSDSSSHATGGQATGGSAEATGGNVTGVEATSNSEGGTANADGGAGGNAFIGDLNIDNSTHGARSVKIRNTPTAIAPDVFPTVTCFRTGALAGSGPGLGFSWGGGKIDSGCEAREEIRLAASFGLIDRALFRWCQLPNNIDSFGSLEACLEFESSPEEVVYETVSEPILLAEVKQEDFDAAVERARIREEGQAKLMAELLERVKKAEEKQEQTTELEDYRQQGIEDYKKKYNEG